MRRICLIVLLTALCVPAASLAGDRAQGDGSLVVSDANGTIIVQGKGLIFGHFDQGTLMVLDYKTDDPTAVISVSGTKLRNGRGSVTYSGNKMRFLFPSGRYTLELIATGIDISVVGKGNVSATGAGTEDDGSFTVNGAKPQPLSKISAGQLFGGKT